MLFVLQTRGPRWRQVGDCCRCCCSTCPPRSPVPTVPRSVMLFGKGVVFVVRVPQPARRQTAAAAAGGTLTLVALSPPRTRSLRWVTSLIYEPFKPQPSALRFLQIAHLNQQRRRQAGRERATTSAAIIAIIVH